VDCDSLVPQPDCSTFDVGAPDYRTHVCESVPHHWASGQLAP
jgi:hypothetical protein